MVDTSNDATSLPDATINESDRVSATVVAIDENTARVALDGGAEGILQRRDLTDRGDWPITVGQQFTVAREIFEISLTGRNSTFTDQMPRQFKVQYSDDGVAWTDALAVVGEANWVVSEVRVYAI